MHAQPFMPRLGILVCVALLHTGCQPAMTGRATLSGRDGLGAAVPDVEFAITKNAGLQASHVLEETRGMQNLTAVKLRMETRNSPTFDDSFHLISLSRFEHTVGSDVPEPTVVSDDPAFVRSHLGDMVHLIVRRTDAPPQVRFTAFAPAPLRPASDSWLVRVAENDRSIPWIVSPGGTVPCFPLSGTDCLDMQSLCTLVLTAVSNGVQAAVSAPLATPIVSLPPPPITASSHALHFVPHASSARFDALGRRLRGFLLIYSVDLAVPVGMATAGMATVFVPISVYFEKDGPDTYRILVDPLTGDVRSNGVVVGWDNPGRIRVEADGVLAPFAGALRDQVRAALVAARLPSPTGVAGEDLLATGVHGVIGTSEPIPNDFDIALLPEGAGTAGATGTTTVMTIPVAGATVINGTPVRLLFLEH